MNRRHPGNSTVAVYEPDITGSDRLSVSWLQNPCLIQKFPHSSSQDLRTVRFLQDDRASRTQGLKHRAVIGIAGTENDRHACLELGNPFVSVDAIQRGHNHIE